MADAKAHGRRISVTGLGYVGGPVAAAFAAAGALAAAFDLDAARVAELKRGIDRTRELAPEQMRALAPFVTDDPARLADADFHIVTVPTPVGPGNVPDLQPLIGAARTIGARLKRGDIVVFESTVYPGTTEEICVPELERTSGLRVRTDFAVGYSPERVNPGDSQHRFESIAKVVSAQDAATLEIVAAVYGSVVRGGIHRAPSIATAEMAKVIENTQRDINIALMNELALICHRLGLDSGDVLAAAGTKWNFLPFAPGLVGGHCIGVDPYYLTYKAERVGHHPKVILSGREVNDGMGSYVAREVLRLLAPARASGETVVTILGVTFKENIADIRNSRVADIVRDLRAVGVKVQAHDPLADADRVEREYGLRLMSLKHLAPAASVIVAVPHRAYAEGGWPLVRKLLAQGRGVVADVRHCLERAGTPEGVVLWRL